MKRRLTEFIYKNIKNELRIDLFNLKFPSCVVLFSYQFLKFYSLFNGTIVFIAKSRINFIQYQRSFHILLIS